MVFFLIVFFFRKFNQQLIDRAIEPESEVILEAASQAACPITLFRFISLKIVHFLTANFSSIEPITHYFDKLMCLLN
jgi:hypothetical protein